MATSDVVEALAAWLLRTSWQAAVLVALVVLIQLTMGKWLAPRWRYALWMLVIVRLLMPVLPRSPASVFNVELPRAEEVAERAAASATPQAAGEVTVTIVKTFDADAQPVAAPMRAIAQAPRSFDWRLALLAAWVAGAVLLIARVVIAHIVLTRRLRRAPSADAEALNLLDDCRRAMRVGTNVRVLVTDAVGGPALFGFVRPKLLVPPALLRDLDREDLRFVLLHELAHLRRRDTLANLLLTLAHALHWFNPLAWLALSRCRTERELACDAMVLELTDGPSQRSYGHTILRLAEAACTTRRRPRDVAAAAALGILPSRSQLTRRITMISAFPHRSRSSSRWSVLPALLLVGVASCALTDKASSDAPATSATTRPAESVAQLTKQSKQLINEARYAEALAVIDQILAADPDITYAQNVRPLVEDKSRMVEQRRIREEYDRRMVNPVNKTEESPATVEARRLLEKALPELKFDNVAFTDVVDMLRDITGANIFVNWRALEAAGIDRQAPVSARLRDVKFAKALTVVLDEVGGGTIKLGYAIDDGVITITTAEDLAKNTETRVYDVRDLLAEVSDYVPQPKAPPAPPTTQPQPKLVEQITSLIQETVEPDLWRDNGGNVAAIRELSGQLIITATAQMHEQIAHLLTQLREGRGVQIVVEMRLFTADPAILDKAMGGKLLGTLGKSGEPTVWQLSDEQAKAVLRDTQREANSTVVTAPRITLFNGQRGAMTVGTETPYVSGFTIFKEADGRLRYEPKIGNVSSGLFFDVRATADADRKQATLALHPKLASLEVLRVAPYMDSKELSVQVPELVVHELQTTVTLPDRGTALVGGFTLMGDPSTQPATAHVEGEQLVVEQDSVRTTVKVPEGGKLMIDAEPAPATAPAVGIPFLRRLTQDRSKTIFMLVQPTVVIGAPDKPKQLPIVEKPAP
jgi:beta-lactamase regulating signal transducer with metallopeptidase domain